MEASSSSDPSNMEVTLSPAASAKGLAALPTELLLKIFADVPNKDLKQISISNKNLAAPAQEQLFSTLTVAPRRRQLRVLMHVSKHQVLSTYIKHLHYDISLYDYRTTLDEYRANLLGRPGVKLTEREILVGYIQTKNLGTEQAKIIKGNEIAVVLSRTLPKFPKLKAISFSDEPSGFSLPGVAPALVPNSADYTNHFKAGVSHYNQPDTGFRNIFRALKRTGVKVKSLSIHPQKNVSFSQHEFLELSSNRSRDMARKAFQSLTDIDMRFSRVEKLRRWLPGLGFHTRPDITLTTPTVVAELLKSAKGLKRLTFGYTDYSRHDRNGHHAWSHYPLFLQFGDEVRWPHLERLELVNMALYDEEIVDFVKLHAATLREVVLERIVIFSALGWDNVAEALQGLRLSGVRIIWPMALPEGPGPAGLILSKERAELRSGDDLERYIMGGRANGSRPAGSQSAEPSKSVELITGASSVRYGH